MPVFFIL